MNIVDHRWREAEQCDSPNQDERPSAEISLIVIHGISLPRGQFGGDEVKSLFLNQLDTDQWGLRSLAGVKVSSHLLITRDGRVTQFVPFDRRAWHAGVSSYQGRERCNDFAVGIELEGTDVRLYTARQYDALARICSDLFRSYGISEIVGHSHIAPGRKTDPGPAFSWPRLRRLMAALLP